MWFLLCLRFFLRCLHDPPCMTQFQLPPVLPALLVQILAGQEIQERIQSRVEGIEDPAFLIITHWGMRKACNSG